MEETINAVTALQTELEAYKISIQPFINLDETVNSLENSPAMPLKLIVMIRYLYYEVSMSIHFPLILPWLNRTNNLSQDLVDQVKLSSSKVAEVARRAISESHLIRLNANTPIS